MNHAAADHHRTSDVADDLLHYAAGHKIADRGSTVVAHRDEVVLLLVGDLDDHVGRVSLLDFIIADSAVETELADPVVKLRLDLFLVVHLERRAGRAAEKPGDVVLAADLARIRYVEQIERRAQLVGEEAAVLESLFGVLCEVDRNQDSFNLWHGRRRVLARRHKVTTLEGVSGE